jgi:hypothetical protein
MRKNTPRRLRYPKAEWDGRRIRLSHFSEANLRKEQSHKMQKIFKKIQGSYACFCMGYNFETITNTKGFSP